MNPRNQLISLSEKLRHFPNKTKIHLIEGAIEILKILSKTPEGNTFLRLPEEKQCVEVIIFYLKPFAKHLAIQAKSKVVKYRNAADEEVQTEFACITNIRPSTLKQLYTLLEAEHLVEEVTHRVSNSYQRIIIGLQLENQRLNYVLKQNTAMRPEEKTKEPLPSSHSTMQNKPRLHMR